MNTKRLIYGTFMAAVLLLCVVPMASALAGTPPTVDATIKINPNTLNIGASGTVTAFITFPDEYDAFEVLPETVTCEGNSMVKGLALKGNSFHYQAKFDMADFSERTPGDDVVLTVRGKAYFNGIVYNFEGFDVIRVIDNRKE